MCSGPHMTEACLAKYKAGEEVLALCPNCNQQHHAWSRRCPSRLTRVDEGVKLQEEWSAAHNPNRPAWTRRSRSRSHQPAPPPAQATLASPAHFPSLPPPSASQAASTASTPTPALPRLPATAPGPALTPAPPPAATSTSTPVPPSRPTSNSGSSPQQEQPAPTLPPPPLPQRGRRQRNRRPQPPPSAQTAPPSTPPGYVLVTKAALEEMLASFALALTGLLQLKPDEVALRVIAKATLEEHFPDFAGTSTTPAPPPPVPQSPAPPPAKSRATGPLPPSIEVTEMEADECHQPPQPGVPPTKASLKAVHWTMGRNTTRSHIPLRTVPTRSRFPLPERRALPKRRGPRVQPRDVAGVQPLRVLQWNVCGVRGKVNLL
ncbi:uncharacterized protein LOC126989402 [Eriocheir sinensis]|uniref:uncharacterized protein LOC126989402 n=1 Tax=Eriocheir sinensis TaxID=95602 RepID=UPI0021C8FF61|nr:uncharacterized protein LOC126989402 [Eriocheir sinensis]